MSDSIPGHHRLDSEDVANVKDPRGLASEAVRFQSIAHNLKWPHDTLSGLALFTKIYDLDVQLLIYRSLQFFFHVVRPQNRTFVRIIYEQKGNIQP